MESEETEGGLKNGYEIKGDRCIIFLRRRYSRELITTTIDAKDLAIASSIAGAWCVSHQGRTHCYVIARIKRGKFLRLHRLLMDAPDGMEVDHINHDCLDNRRANLRVVTHQENILNRRGPAINGTSGIRGVTRRSDGKKWVAQVARMGRCIYLGSFFTKGQAAKAVEHYRQEVLGCLA